jgi:hypothetical protein
VKSGEVIPTVVMLGTGEEADRKNVEELAEEWDAGSP